MHIKDLKENSRFISVEMERQELAFFYDCISKRISSPLLKKEDKTRLISFVTELKNIINGDKV